MLTVDFYTKSDFYFFPELLQLACIIFIIRKILNNSCYYKDFISNIHVMGIN